VPREVSGLYTDAGHIRTVRLRNAWAQRRFAICFRKRADLTPAAERLLDYLSAQAAICY